MRLPASTAALAALALACSSAQKCPEAPAPPATPAAITASPAASAAPRKKTDATPRISITLEPNPSTGTVDVDIIAAADPASLKRWSITADGGAAAFHLKAARDDKGPLETQLTDKNPGEPLAISLARPATGDVHISYTVDSRTRKVPSFPTVDVDPNRFQASGDALLLLPDGLDDRLVTASVRFNTLKYGTNEDEPMARSASSFGVGEAREAAVTGRALRLGAYISGRMGRALFDTAEGHDEAAWFGYTSFDPRSIVADVAAFRTAVRELLRDKGQELMTLLIVVDNRQSGAFVAVRWSQSVLVHVGVSEPWSGPVRIAVAAEVLHAWFGERLWIGPTDSAHEAEAYWFTEGVTRNLARDLLFRFGLITGAELLDEIHGLASVLATSPRRTESNASLAAHRKEPGAVPLLVARGALYAARVDALLRKKSGDPLRLDDVLRGLFEKAREKRAALPTSAWIDAVSAELGDGERAAFTKAIEQGAGIEIPEGAFGPCFRGDKRRYEAFDLGFDEEATRASTDHTIQGMRPGGPAEKAGLRKDDVLIEAVLRRGRSEAPVTLTVERGGEKKTISYRPAGATATGQGWVRKKDVPDEACTK